MDEVGAEAAYIPVVGGKGVILFRTNPTISSVLEETYHAKQNRRKAFSELSDGPQVVLMREIEAQEYLLSVKEKYKIPTRETEKTMQALAEYKHELAAMEGG